MDKNILAIIPARGGSKGIKRKNLQLIGHKTLLENAIDIAQNSRLINRLIVSSEDSEILNISKSAKAEIIKRPKKLSRDTSKTEDVLLHALSYLEKKENYIPDILALLQCTAPFMIPNDIDRAIQHYLKTKSDSVFVGAIFYNDIWKKSKNSKFIGINHNSKYRIRRQDKERQYIEAGSIYILNPKKYIKYRNRFFGKTSVYLIPKIRIFEIDQPEDLKLANHLLGFFNLLNET